MKIIIRKIAQITNHSLTKHLSHLDIKLIENCEMGWTQLNSIFSTTQNDNNETYEIYV